MTRKAIAFTALAILFTAVAAGATTYNVNIFTYGYTPSTVNIIAGDTVHWKNTVSLAHTATDDAFTWDSGFLGLNQTYDHQFATPGLYPYHCEVHPTLMFGIVNVQLPVPVAPKSWGGIKALFR